jgi:hypothetical protein
MLINASLTHGWKMCFFASAGLGVPWCILWLLVVSSSPPTLTGKGRARAAVGGSSTAVSAYSGINSSNNASSTNTSVKELSSTVDIAQPPSTAHTTTNAQDNTHLIYRASNVSNQPMPTWVDLTTSPAAIAGYISSFGSSWVFYMLLTFLPQYLEQRFNFDLGKSGVR